MRKIAWIALLVLVTAAPVCAQTLTNPSTVQFTASADHNTVENTVTLLTAYEVRLYTPTGTTPITAVSIGKPTPDATNTISYTQLPSVYVTAPAGTYVVKIVAIGPGGASAETPASVPFLVAVRKPSAPTGAPIIK